ncbi:CoA transferase, partial [Bordetella bronchiseptica]|uniref:CoA transferase n=1 Tax=Bordetella bronchiseptica TaxID=518 RepID=UPI00045984AF
MHEVQQQSPAPAAKPLAGYRVLDLTTFLSGPFCTQILADLGAEVIKVEAPDGDSSRHIPPHFVDGDSAYYLGINRDKKSLAVDMKQPEGLALVKSLIARSHVVVEIGKLLDPGAHHQIGVVLHLIGKGLVTLVEYNDRHGRFALTMSWNAGPPWAAPLVPAPILGSRYEHCI